MERPRFCPFLCPALIPGSRCCCKLHILSNIRGQNRIGVLGTCFLLQVSLLSHIHAPGFNSLQVAYVMTAVFFHPLIRVEMPLTSIQCWTTSTSLLMSRLYPQVFKCTVQGLCLRYMQAKNSLGVPGVYLPTGGVMAVLQPCARVRVPAVAYE